MLNFLNIFKKKSPEKVQPMEMQPKKVEESQNDLNTMKDGLPLVNEGLLEQPTEMEIVYIQGTNEVVIGDIISVNLVSGETDLGYELELFNEDKGVAKLKKDGAIIKVKK